MSTVTRETRLNAAFVKLADTLTDDFDVVDLLHTDLLHTLVEECTAIFDVQAGGLMLADGRLQLVASTSESAELVEIMQLNAGKSPCVECFQTGKQLAVADIATSGERWPEFQAEALRQGFLSINATPLRLHRYIEPAQHNGRRT